MKFLALLATAAVATAASIPNPFSPIPGYPLGVGCLSDPQANFIVKNFVGMLTNVNRNQTLATAKVSIADGYTELSDSINTLEFDPVSSFLPTGALYVLTHLSSPGPLLSLARRHTSPRWLPRLLFHPSLPTTSSMTARRSPGAGACPTWVLASFPSGA